MKREEAIKLIDTHTVCFYNEIDSPTLQALHLAIEALKTDIVYCYECKYNGNCCQCVDIIDDLLSLNFCGRGERKEVVE